MSIKHELFGRTQEGGEASLYTLTNGNGMKVCITDYGANITRIIVPDNKGNMDDIVLGYDTIAGYEGNKGGYGSFIGRNANRIKGGSFTINGKEYSLPKNDGENNLHSGTTSYNKYMYGVELFEEENSCSIELSRLSPHMEQGFPGNLDISVTYTLTQDNELVIEYMAISDRDTVVNLTNHSYFNLAGHDRGDILNHKVMIDAHSFTPTDDTLIPTGEIVEVEGTPMDFRRLKPIGQDINADYTPLKQAGGYDHNYCLNQNNMQVEKVAELVEDVSGRIMEVYTDMPGLQFYTGNFISGDETGKDGVIYQKNAGVCFETQYYPDSCNISHFPSPILKAGVEYHFVTVYKFGVKR